HAPLSQPTSLGGDVGTGAGWPSQRRTPSAPHATGAANRTTTAARLSGTAVEPGAGSTSTAAVAPAGPPPTPPLPGMFVRSVSGGAHPTPTRTSHRTTRIAT